MVTQNSHRHLPAASGRDFEEVFANAPKRRSDNRTLTDFTQTKFVALSIPKLAERFMQTCRQGGLRDGRPLSLKTIEFYQICLKGLVAFAAIADWPAPGQLTRDHLRDYRYFLENEPRYFVTKQRPLEKASPCTVRHYLNVAKIFLNWCEEEEYIANSPARHFRLPAPNNQDVEPYRDDEINAMLAVCENDIAHGNRFFGVRNKAIISVFIDTGLRLNELCGMGISELDPALQQVRVLGKGAKMRVVPLNGEARRALKLYLKEFRRPGGNEVWQTEDGQPLTFHGVRLLIDRLKARAGVPSDGGAHRFRHYFATRYLENGGDLNSLRLLLGHATLYMVLRYTKYVDMRSAVAKSGAFSPLDRLTRGEKGSHRDDSWGWRR